MSKRILVVEDQEDNRQIIRDMLSATDYEITEAGDGEQALAAVAKQRPDLILMDIQLPIIDGYEATRRIKADPALRSIPIIASPPMRSVAKNRKRERLAAMTLCRSPTVHDTCWGKFVNTCLRSNEYVPPLKRRRLAQNISADEWVTASSEWINDCSHGQQQRPTAAKKVWSWHPERPKALLHIDGPRFGPRAPPPVANSVLKALPTRNKMLTSVHDSPPSQKNTCRKLYDSLPV